MKIKFPNNDDSWHLDEIDDVLNHINWEFVKYEKNRWMKCSQLFLFACENGQVICTYLKTYEEPKNEEERNQYWYEYVPKGHKVKWWAYMPNSPKLILPF